MKKPTFIESVPTKEPAPFVLKCVSCRDVAELIFQGTTYCTKCVNEGIRVGTA